MLEFESALSQLPEALRAGVASHWREFSDAAADAGVALPTDGTLLLQLVRVWAGSEFVARTCIRYPDAFIRWLAQGDLSLRRGDDGLEVGLAEVSDEAELSVVLRQFRRREMVRIIWRDLAGLAPLDETLADLSRLADASVAQALEQLYLWQCERFGVPQNDLGQALRLVVLAMGKLGGRELNLSSDIDLVFAYPQQGQTDARRPISNEEFFRRLGQSLIRALQEPTSEGFVFRVDMRLRPFGESGPLVTPFRALEDYYQSHGRDWERYAMIKARVITGDGDAEASLLDCLRPFVYRRYLDYGAFESLRSMKEMIAKEVERKGLQHNIKLGPGGIREIEFIAQAFQLIYGGREPVLRQRSILPVLDQLAESKRLPTAAVEGLKQAYGFLRRTENRLQAWADRQVHTLPKPDDPIARLRLAYAMGFPAWDGFMEALSQHIALVSSQFEQIFATPRTGMASARKEPDFAAVWNESSGTEAATRFLEQQGYDDPASALASLRQLQGSFSNRALAKSGRERMDQLIPLLMQAVSASPRPAKTLGRITRLLEAIARRSVYLALLVERPTVLTQLVRLCGASVWIADHLTRYPLLLDDLLDPRTLYSPLDRVHLQEVLEYALGKVPVNDAEQVLDALRHFKQSQVLRVAAADVSDAIPLMIVSDRLTEIAEVLVGKVLELAWSDLTPRFGRPRCKRDGKEVEPGFAVVAYGKLGGIELGYGSDLDLVFLHDSAGGHGHTTGPREVDNATFFFKLTQRVIHMLTAQTGAGLLYEVDTRLRPSGRSGLLVSSLEAFETYQREQAWTWEHQALVRARVVAGSPHLVARFNEIRQAVLGRPRDAAALRQEVREMRARMHSELAPAQPGYFHIKHDRGGIADIEFMVQYKILANAHNHPVLLTYTDNIRQLDGLEQVGILSSAEAGFLRDAYRALRRQSHLQKLQEQSSRVPEQTLLEYREGVVGIWRELMEDGNDDSEVTA